eukprot:CAMPEP_0198296660 /NCGR_PEP_ID=MMETSP1449-20131203/33352_1 /TAXON_ID=420275 /ORGANISM="Attheya septentrionalis, Strain CCMP2084" /LENGTH=68 /DNA_ID=CAMNT_0043997327 /DNA_START=42 /DNA_END=245 /DNA_ORIENTATION=+
MAEVTNKERMASIDEKESIPMSQKKNEQVISSQPQVEKGTIHEKVKRKRKRGVSSAEVLGQQRRRSKR